MVSGNKIIGGPGNPESPYNVSSAAVVSILNNGEEWEYGLHKFRFYPEFLLGNMGATPIRFSIKLNEQEWQHIYLDGIPVPNWESLLDFEYEFDEDHRTLTAFIELEFTGNIIYESICEIPPIFKKPQDPQGIIIGGINGGDSLNLTGDIYDGIYDYGETPQAATGVARIFYATNRTNDGTIRNPIIFIDGYDPTNSRSIKELYDGKINKNIFINNNTIGFAEYLRSIGFDLIIIDPHRQDRFIEENALLLKDCITQIWNANHTYMESDFVIVGPSLGAILCQFALSYMESRSIPHHTRLYISFDGPHQGANVPIGVQNMVNYLLQGKFLNKITFGKLDEIKYNIYDNPCGRQLIAYHCNSSSQYPTCDNYRDIFLTHLANEGTYPQIPRKIAFINGSIDGIKNPHTTVCGNFTDIQYERYRIMIQQSTIINWKTYSSAESSSNDCKNSEFYTIAPLINLVTGLQLHHTNYSFGNSANTSLDVCPASYIGDVLDVNTHRINIVLTIWDILSYLPGNGVIYSSHVFDIDNLKYSSFIPSTSSADIQQGSPNLYRKISDDFLSNCSGITPFDWVYGAHDNTDHVSISDDMATNTIQELTLPLNELIPFPVPEPSASASYIPSTNKYKYQFNFPTPPIGQSYNWQVVEIDHSNYTAQLIAQGALASLTLYSIPDQERDLEFQVEVTLANNCVGGHSFSYKLKNLNINSKIRYKPATEQDKIQKDYPQITLYPNPTNNGVNLFFLNFPSYETKMEIYDISGRIVKQFGYKDYQTNLININASELHPGSYFIRINDPKKKVEYLKFQKI